MPVVMTDDFAGVAGAFLDGRVAGGLTWSCAGLTATDVTLLRLGTANQLRIVSGNGCLGRIEAGSTEHYAKISSLSLTQTSTVAPAVRAVDHNNHVGLRVFSSTSVELYKLVGGTLTRLVLATVATLTTPVVLEVRFEAGVAKGFVNGAAIGAVAGYAVADAIFSGVTKVGVWGKGNLNPCADDFEAGTLGTTVALGPVQARSASRGGAPVLGAVSALAPVAARSATRGGSPVLGAVSALAPVRGRSTGRGGVPALTAGGTTLGAVPARHAVRAGSPTLAARSALTPAGALHVLRGGAAAVTVAPVAMLAAARSRHPVRSSAGSLVPVPGAVIARVAAEVRTVGVPRL